MIRVALLVEPPMLRSVLASLLAAAPEIAVIDSAAPPDTADVVVLSQADPENETVPLSMLYRSPRSRVLVLGTDARRATLFELRPHRAVLGELSRESLLAAVRGTAEEAAT